MKFTHVLVLIGLIVLFFGLFFANILFQKSVVARQMKSERSEESTKHADRSKIAVTTTSSGSNSGNYSCFYCLEEPELLRKYAAQDDLESGSADNCLEYEFYEDEEFSEDEFDEGCDNLETDEEDFEDAENSGNESNSERLLPSFSPPSVLGPYPEKGYNSSLGLGGNLGGGYPEPKQSDYQP